MKNSREKRGIRFCENQSLFSSEELILSLFLFPQRILTVSWWMTRRFWVSLPLFRVPTSVCPVSEKPKFPYEWRENLRLYVTQVESSEKAWKKKERFRRKSSQRRTSRRATYDLMTRHKLSFPSGYNTNIIISIFPWILLTFLPLDWIMNKHRSWRNPSRSSRIQPWRIHEIHDGRRAAVHSSR